MLNAEKFRDEIFDNDNNLICDKLRDVFFRETKENQFKSLGKVVRWLLSEYKEPILDEVEREYLSAVCKPYEVVYISKIPNRNKNKCFIYVKVKNTASDGVYESIQLPFFYTQCLYTEMELKKKYTPQEIGIKCKNNPKGEIKNENC